MISFLLSVSLKPIFDLINTLQIHGLLPLSHVVMPYNARIFFQILIIMIDFDYIPIYDPGFTEQEPFNDKFGTYGIEYVNFPLSLGVFLWYVICTLIL